MNPDDGRKGQAWNKLVEELAAEESKAKFPEPPKEPSRFGGDVDENNYWVAP